MVEESSIRSFSSAVVIDLDVNYKERTINLSKIPVIGHLFEILGIKDLDIKDPILHQEKSQFLLINDIYKK